MFKSAVLLSVSYIIFHTVLNTKNLSSVCLHLEEYFFFFFNEEKTLPKPFLKFSIFLCLAACVEFFLGWDTLLLKRLGKLSLSCKVDVRKKRTWRIETVKDIRAFLDFHLVLFRQK